jgi:hypothetical protein
MLERRILTLTTQNLRVCRWQRNEVLRELDFALDAQGQADFRQWLDQHRDTLFHLLVDLPDEGFHQETLPHVKGSDRKALLERKLNQRFFGSPYSLVRSLGREKQGRRDENFLFAALTRPQALEPWLLAMHDAHASLAGIHSPALILPEVLNKEAAGEPRLILITLGSGGLRQSYFEHGQLRFSRLKPLTTGGIEEAAVNIYGEAVRIYQYLVGQRLISRGNKVPVLCLADAAHFDLLRQACVDTMELSFSFSNLGEITRARQLQTVPTDSNIDGLLIHLLARRRSPAQFGNADTRLDYRRWRWRRLIHASTLATLTLAALFAVTAGVATWLNHIRVGDALLQSEIAQQRYDKLVESLPAIPINPVQLRQLTEEWRRLQASSPDFADSLQPLSAALKDNPQIELQSLDWRLSGNPDSISGTSANATAPQNWLVMDIEAQLPNSLGASRRAQNEAVEIFVAALKRDPNDNVRILQQPFDTDSTKSLKGSSEAYAGKESLRFTVRYWRKLET